MLEQLVGDSQALDRAIAGQELSYKDGLELMNYDNLHLLGAVADAHVLEVEAGGGGGRRHGDQGWEEKRSGELRCC